MQVRNYRVIAPWFKFKIYLVANGYGVGCGEAFYAEFTLYAGLIPAAIRYLYLVPASG